MSGHSKWATIKHKKGALDAKRGKLFTKLIREMTIAARIGGGDPGSNPRLRTAVDKAKAANMPADNITRAIKKGTGELEGTTYEDLQLEGYGPGGVAILVEGSTDNRNRSVSEIRHIFTKHGGNLGGAGSVAYMFKPKGVIAIAADKTTEDKLMEIALEAGADDIQCREPGLHRLHHAARLRGRPRGDQEGRHRARRGRGQEAGREQHRARGRQGPAAAEARRGARRPRRRAERVGQLRHLREGDGGSGGQLGRPRVARPRRRSRLAAHGLRGHRHRRPPPPPRRDGGARARRSGSSSRRSCATSTRASPALIERLHPDALAVEDVFHAANTRTALVLGHVRGVVLLAGAERGVPVHEYPPATVKQQVTGFGRAEKSQVAFMVTRLLELGAEAEPGDATDALAVALCFGCQHGSASVLAAASAPRPAASRSTGSRR